MPSQKSRRQPRTCCFGFLDSHACHLSPCLVINTPDGYFHFLPFLLFFFLATGRNPSVAAAVDLRICTDQGRCITLFVPETLSRSSAAV